ncbi:methylmalonic aciduria and homocystinuria type D protein, mitochondrial isoform X2 [Cephus cinctus]|uniref:Methylmalonic aciduria and homocystinuria type D protein, mitochondrial isoform X2 n=1 Tax=Cephus cinctus TaxID=211228 RepID=A0AAJ7FF68_CEPCN|nr:methylmalonic aciduria and homocystinuria type D protein, mitochondrial isoform X2 [Cephus cinctus]
MMLCANSLKRNCVATPVNIILKAKYSRRNHKDTSSYKVVKSNSEPVDDVENNVFGVSPNWELLPPRGFRFYLPGTIGPGWLDASTTAQVETRSFVVNTGDDILLDGLVKDAKSYEAPIDESQKQHPLLHCTVQECPMLLRKGIMELFPGCVEVNSPQLSIITISQKMNRKTIKWNREAETEKLAKYFLLAASDVCTKLKLIGYWADFINPFSGQPYFNPHKNGTLYKTDERFRCLGFQIQEKNRCKVISHSSNSNNFVGSLYTTAPSNMEFLKELMNDINQ